MSKAFTLVELLISIGIMAVVFGVIISSTSQIQKQGRDTQRQADLRTIQGSLQQYYADQGYYPDDDNSTGVPPPPPLPLNLPSTTVLTSDVGASPSPFPSPRKDYLKVIPKDPSSGRDYEYKAYLSSNDLTINCDNSSATNKCNFYELCAQLEGIPDSNYCGTATHNLKVTPQ